VLWKALRFSEINLSLERRILHIKAVAAGIIRETLETILHIAGLIELDGDEQKEENMTVTILKKLRITMVSCEEPIV
jgi:hypothetical protein